MLYVERGRLIRWSQVVQFVSANTRCDRQVTPFLMFCRLSFLGRVSSVRPLFGALRKLLPVGLVGVWEYQAGLCWKLIRLDGDTGLCDE